MSLLDAALDLAAHGCAVVPVRTDGTKAPAVDWKAYQASPPTRDELDRWFGLADFDGLGVITGAVSGQLEMLEVEGRAVHLASKLGELLADHDLGELWARLCTGWLEVSPSGGMHWLYRVDGQARGNTKLARRRNADNDRVVDVLLETRGEGGFVVTAPSAGRSHPSGKAWTIVAGGPSTCPLLTVDERDTLYAIAAMLDEMPTGGMRPYDPEQPAYVGDPRSATGDGDRPGDAYNAQVEWAEILEPAGWTRSKRLGDGFGWTRPGKDARDGISATTGTAADGVDRLYVFSTSTEFEAETPYSKFGAYALLHHGGDHAAAASVLRKAGFGAPLEPRPALTLLPGLTDGHPDQVGQAAPLMQPEVAVPLDLYERAVQTKLYDLRVADEARKRLLVEKEGDAGPFDAGTLAEMLLLPPEPPHRIDELIPSGAFTLIVAERKTGKTTLTLGLTRCLLTGEEFLGRFAVRPLQGKVAFLNYEVSGQQLARWASDAEIPAERLVLVNLRGRRNPLAVPDDRARLAGYLREHGVDAIIVDPFSRAFVGKSQNDAAEVQPWLLELDRFARTEVGASEVILTAHTGWGGERARGSSALEGHPDVTITMTRDAEDKTRRYLSAEGRDVLVEEDELLYDHATRSLVLTGDGSRKARAFDLKMQKLTAGVVTIVQERPGITATQLKEACVQAGYLSATKNVGVGGVSVPRAVERAENGHHITVKADGSSKRYYPTQLTSVSAGQGIPPHTSPIPPHSRDGDIPIPYIGDGDIPSGPDEGQS